MAERAHPCGTVVVSDAWHVVMISHPQEVVKVIEDAATAPYPVMVISLVLRRQFLVTLAAVAKVSSMN